MRQEYRLPRTKSCMDGPAWVAPENEPYVGICKGATQELFDIPARARVVYLVLSSEPSPDAYAARPDYASLIRLHYEDEWHATHVFQAVGRAVMEFPEKGTFLDLPVVWISVEYEV